METKLKTAIILGATGLTGSLLLQRLLKDKRYGKIKLFSRSSTGKENAKLEEFIGDVIELENFKNDFEADEVFCCIGTTKAKTPDKDIYKKIDFGIPVQAAELCKKNGIDTLIIISALGANSKSKLFYNRTKGEMEDAVLKMQIPKTHILQPSLISGKREEKRIGELVFKQLMKVANLVMAGPLKKFKSIHPQDIAKTMLWVANNTYNRIRIPSDLIQKISK
ncbi:NAD(P)H-binding protein [Maribacter sp. HTCC2170]|uniref:NAD(P)H-binding protein n=1 Tax=Maribacter sp. (strain HTCC2170 / KCCM 42371) TaxID=313603 RepID=UPI00006BD523|nr:NAD(P)H-binding protein [Maribacter sp. HTCC2170]EAR02939.1 nucleoside-diphosphate-sugar epimerase [Maribacter sp. HTCC2170]